MESKLFEEGSTSSDTRSSNSPTIRLTLELKDPDEDNYSVFNYEALISAERKQQRTKNLTKVPGENNEDDPEVKRLAQHFMNKYGNSSSSNNKKKKKKKVPLFFNYSELGNGYDENDSFIDNSEFDEAMPEDKETFHGGYYVNVGLLKLKEVKVPEKDLDDDIRTGKKRNGILASDDSESEDDDRSGDEESNSKNNAEHSKIEKLPKDTNKIEESSKNISVSLSGVQVEAVKQNGDIDKKKNTKKRKLLEENGIPDCASKLKRKSSTVKSMLEVKRTNDDSKPNENTLKDKVDMKCSNNDIVINNVPKNDIEAIMKLPDNLPSDLLELISEIKSAARASDSGFRTLLKMPSFCEKLMRLEIYVKALKAIARHSVYDHVTSFLQCSKDTLMKRCKKVLADEEEKYTSEPFSKLKTCVEKLMPASLERHNLMSLKVTDEKNVGEVKIGEPDEKENSLSKIPLKQFVWTEECRVLLKDLVMCRLKCYDAIKPKKDNVNEYVKKYLELKVKPIWPSGWMDTPTLLKESQYHTTFNSRRSLPVNPTSVPKSASSASGPSRKSLPSLSQPSTSKMSGMNSLTSTTDFSILQNAISLTMNYAEAPLNIIGYPASESKLPAVSDPSDPQISQYSRPVKLLDSHLSHLPKVSSSSTLPAKSTSPKTSTFTSSSSSLISQFSKIPTNVDSSCKIDPLVVSPERQDLQSNSKPKMNHATQYNKHYSHKTEKRKSTSGTCYPRNSGIKKEKLSAAVKSHNQNVVSKSSNGGRVSSNDISKDDILDLSPPKNKTETSNNQFPANQVYVKDELVVKKVKSAHFISDSRVSGSSSKPSPINRKQRLLQESTKSTSVSSSLNGVSQPTKRSGNLHPSNGYMNESRKSIASNERDQHSISRLNKEEQKKVPPAMFGSMQFPFPESLLSKVIEETFKSFSPVEPRHKLSDRVSQSPDFFDQKNRPSSRDSSHSSASSSNADRRTPIDLDFGPTKDVKYVSRKLPMPVGKDIGFSSSTSVIGQSSLITNNEKNSNNLSMLSDTAMRNEIFKQVFNNFSGQENGGSYNINGSLNQNSLSNCSTSEPTSLESEHSYSHKKSVIINPANSGWYSTESKP